jgi:hypothetical protein
MCVLTKWHSLKEDRSNIDERSKEILIGDRSLKLEL